MSNKKEFERVLITAALPYANGPLHIGHIAGCFLPADIFARYSRLIHNDVLFIGGSDEHGVPITLRAQKENTTPQLIVNKYHQMMKQSFEELGITFDIYSRTSSKNHHYVSQEIFTELYTNNCFTEEVTEQYFDEKANQFLADRYIVGTCPKCQNPDAYGDQCEKCGSTLSPAELINPRSALSGNKPVLKKTKNWYLPLDKLQPKLQAFIDSHKDDWKSNVYGQCNSWLNQGLQPRAMTRDLEWGVPVPLQDAREKVMYVWFDAPIGYISFTRELRPNDWEKYWKDESSRIIHFIGKDNIVFHCIIFPAMLMCANGYQVADNVPANEFLNLEGEKISTSRNHAVWLHEYLNDFKGRTDELRYVLTAIAPETKDADFTWKDFQLKVNSELVSNLGNFVNRVMVLSHKFYEGKITDAKNISGDVMLAIDNAMVNVLQSISKCKSLLNDFKFRDAQFEMMQVARIGNKLLADTEPWKKIKTSPEDCAAILFASIKITTAIAYLCDPFLPKTSKNIFSQLNYSFPDKFLFWSKVENIKWLEAGHQLGETMLLFKNIEDNEIELQLKKLTEAKKINSSEKGIPPMKNEISFDDFSKTDIRIGTILAASKVNGTDKLLQLVVDTGIDKRTVVSGIAQYYSPDEIIGKKVSILVNLAPRKIRGVESHGMILMAENSEGKLSFVTPVENDINNGSVVS